MTKKTDLVVQPTPMVEGDRAQHVLTGEIVTVIHSVSGIVQAYNVLTGHSELFHATEMELIRLPKK